MTILADTTIQKLCQSENMIVPFEERLLNPTGYDLTIDNNVLVESDPGPTNKHNLITFHELDIFWKTQESPYYLAPGDFILCCSEQTFNMPENVAGQFVLKSSRAREGYQHMMAGYCEPSWNNSKLTMEIRNATRYHYLPIWPGMRIGQLVFSTAEKPQVSYAEVGHYNGDGSTRSSVTGDKRGLIQN